MERFLTPEVFDGDQGIDVVQEEDAEVAPVHLNRRRGDHLIFPFGAVGCSADQTELTRDLPPGMLAFQDADRRPAVSTSTAVRAVLAAAAVQQFAVPRAQQAIGRLAQALGYWSAKYLKEVGLQESDLSYPLLTDNAHVVSALYGVAFQMRIHTEWSNRPATFIIDRQGILRYARRAKTFGDRPTPEEILEQLEKLD
jgi:hypothetical protein